MKLIHGECLKEMDLLIEQGVVVDCILTDPPYGTTACQWDSVIPFDAMWERLNRLIKPNGAIVLFGSEPFSSALRMSNIKNYKYDWYWNKNRPGGTMMANKQPLRAVENLLVFSNFPHFYNPQKTKRTEKELKQLSKKSVFSKTITNLDNRKWTKSSNRKDNILKYPINILKHKTVFNRGNEKLPHPTQKPIALMEYLIKTYTNENETILDFTMGSGTTGVACKNLNRDFIGIEMNDKYFEIASNRINNTTDLLF